MKNFKDILNVQIQHEIVINICSAEKWLRVIRLHLPLLFSMILSTRE